MKRNVNVEEQIDKFVPTIGGVLISELLGDKNPNKQPNADYLFYSHNVVAELKCLEESLLSKPDYDEAGSGLPDVSSAHRQITG